MPLGRNPRKGEVRKAKKAVKKIGKNAKKANRIVANKGKRMPSKRAGVHNAMRAVDGATKPVGRTVG
jgi:hypothetical protein